MTDMDRRESLEASTVLAGGAIASRLPGARKRSRMTCIKFARPPAPCAS